MTKIRGRQLLLVTLPVGKRINPSFLVKQGIARPLTANENSFRPVISNAKSNSPATYQI
jgi:hypothetical protein